MNTSKERIGELEQVKRNSPNWNKISKKLKIKNVAGGKVTQDQWSNVNSQTQINRLSEGQEGENGARNTWRNNI